jgi:hypothetical protein
MSKTFPQPEADEKRHTAYIQVPVNTNSYDRDGNPRVVLEIEGLELFSYDEVTGRLALSLKGLTQKNRNWFEALNELGYADLGDQDREILCDKLSTILFRYDIGKVLTDRIKIA